MEWVKENLESNFKFVGVSFIIQETYNRNVYKEKIKIIENKINKNGKILIIIINSNINEMIELNNYTSSNWLHFIQFNNVFYDLSGVNMDGMVHSLLLLLLYKTFYLNDNNVISTSASQ